MPSKEAHIAAANENQEVIDYLLNRVDDFPGWVVTVAFYKAVHVVEAMFAHENAIGGHTDQHTIRNNTLKRTKQYQHIWKNYRLLWQASLIARYLRENNNRPTYEVFSRHIPPNRVKPLAIDHWLHQVEKAVGKRIGDENFLEPAA